jgi:hypothetical protein
MSGRTRLENRAPARLAQVVALAWLGLALAAAAHAAETTPQIFKCTDSAGNVTYQNEACPKNAKAGRIDIFDNRWSASKDEREAEWRRNAADHHVVAGMPSVWVREALGEPSEIRDTPVAGAAQLWIYNLPERAVQVGMLNDQVLWSRETPTPPAPMAQAAPQSNAQAPQPAARVASAPQRPADLPVTHLAPPAPESAAAAPAAPSTQRAPEASPSAAKTAPPPPSAVASAQPPTVASAEPSTVAPAQPAPSTASKAGANRAVARGQDCKQVLAGLGPPSRQRDVPALDAGSEPATEYFYDASSAGGAMRVVCSNGLVEGVDRSVAR